MNFTLGIVVAKSQNNGFGFKDPSKGLPWPHLKKDMTKFGQLTTTVISSKNALINKKNVVIMGKNTYLSIPENMRPLKGRMNFIVSSTLKPENVVGESVRIFTNLTDAIKVAKEDLQVQYVFVIGGAILCEEAMNMSICSHLFITEINKTFDAEVFFPEISKKDYVKEVCTTYEENGIEISDVVYKRIQNDSMNDAMNDGINLRTDYSAYIRELFDYEEDKSSFEYEYLDCMKRVLENGERCSNRTGIDTISVFDENMHFDIKTLSDGSYQLPVLTTKKIFLKGAITELLWMLRGGTSAKWLQERDVHIWDGNSTREYLDKIGLGTYKEGELGPVYGHQWINWGSTEWQSDKKDIKKDGINQIRNIIETIKRDSFSRRLVLSAWNVSDLDKMALPPCHIMYIFKVSDHNKEKKTLNCKLTLRSNDMFLGSPFNILNTAVLTILMSKACGMNPGRIAISITDAHIYVNHVEMVREQLSRVPFKFPSMRIDKKIDCWEDMLDLTLDDFKLHNYQSWPLIKAPMAV
jgi:dihydrofolate reductase/thymidylate synthase